MNKKLIRLTESDLHRIVKESVKRILRENEITGGPGENMMNDTTTSVYYCCRRELAQRAIDLFNSGNGYKLVGKGNIYGNGIYATLRPNVNCAYGDTIIELLVPSSAVKPIFSKRDGEFCVLNPNDIYEARLYR